MTTSSDDLRWRAAYAACAVAGVASLAAVQHLPWRETEYHLALPVRWVVVVAGLVVLAVAARAGATGRVGAAMLALGASVATYPALLTLSATGIGGPALSTLGNAGHVVPLTMVQLIPVLVSEQATARSRKGWVRTILAVAVGGGVLTGVGLASGEGGAAMLVVATGLWFVSFAFAPIACWAAIRGTSGHSRRRGVVAGLAAIVPVLVIVWCATLGGLGSALALAESATTTALFLGFAAATAGCALLSVVALRDGPSPLLGHAVVVGSMRAMVVAVVALVASGLALASAALLPTGEAAVLVAVAVTVALGWGGQPALQLGRDRRRPRCRAPARARPRGRPGRGPAPAGRRGRRTPSGRGRRDHAGVRRRRRDLGGRVHRGREAGCVGVRGAGARGPGRPGGGPRL